MSAPITVLFPIAGLTHLGYRFKDSAGAYIGARVTSGITEDADSVTGNGRYRAASPATPSNAFGVTWNDSVVTSMVASQEFDFEGNVNPSSTGYGPKPVTIHCTDGSAAALSGVSITVLDASTGALLGSGTTDGSGNLVVNLPSSTALTISTFKSGYTSSASIQSTSSGTTPQTLSTIVLTTTAAIPPATRPSQCNIGGTITDAQGNALNGVVVRFQLVSPSSARPLVAGGGVVEVRVVEVTSGSGTYQDGVTPWPSGYCEAQVTRNDAISPNNTTWTIISTDGGSLNTVGKVVAAASINFADL